MTRQVQTPKGPGVQGFLAPAEILTYIRQGHYGDQREDFPKAVGPVVEALGRVASPLGQQGEVAASIPLTNRHSTEMILIQTPSSARNVLLTCSCAGIQTMYTDMSMSICVPTTVHLIRAARRGHEMRNLSMCIKTLTVSWTCSVFFLQPVSVLKLN